MFSFFKKKSPSNPASNASPPVDAAPGTGQAGAAVPEATPPAAAVRQGWLSRLKAGLGKTAASISGVFGGNKVDEALYEDLESALLMADAGVAATQFLIADLRKKARAAGVSQPQALKELLITSLGDLLQVLERPLEIGKHQPTVVMVAGVNGAGKTTSIGKLTRHLADAGSTVLLAAADTFRAAARNSLQCGLIATP